MARRLRLSGTIHDLQLLELGAFSPEKAQAFLVARGRYYNWELSSETIEAVLRAVEWPIPFYLNLVMEQLRTIVAEQQRLRRQSLSRALSRV